MAELALDVFDVLLLLDQQTRKSVSQVMKSDLRNLRIFQRERCKIRWKSFGEIIKIHSL